MAGVGEGSTWKVAGTVPSSSPNCSMYFCAARTAVVRLWHAPPSPHCQHCAVPLLDNFWNVRVKSHHSRRT